MKNKLLNHKHCGKWFPDLKNTVVSTDPLKETIKMIMVGVLLLKILILKNAEESEYQNSKFNNNGNNSYEIKPKTYKIKDLVALSWR